MWLTALFLILALVLSGCALPASSAGVGSSPVPVGTPSVVATGSQPVSVVSPPVDAGNLPAGTVQARLVKVIDGDTIDVSIGARTERVRYVGIDTPERSQPGFKAATEANRTLLGSGLLYLVRDVSDRDRTSSHRLLRYVYTADGTLVERELVARGWAQPVEYPPDTRFAKEFRQLAVQAARQKLGFWAPAPSSGGAMSYGLALTAADVRKGPGTVFGITTTIPKDTPLTVFGRTPRGDWLQVRTPSRRGGWTAASLVRLNVPVMQVPVPEKIPSSLPGRQTPDGSSSQPPSS